jgi:hypothetical protein
VDFPTTRQDLDARLRKAKWLGGVRLVVALAPGLIYISLPKVLGRPDLWPTPSDGARIWVALAFLAWAVASIFGADPWAFRKAGLICMRCGHLFGRGSFEAVMTTGRCDGCGALVLKDSEGVTPNTSFERTREG